MQQCVASFKEGLYYLLGTQDGVFLMFYKGKTAQERGVICRYL